MRFRDNRMINPDLSLGEGKSRVSTEPLSFGLDANGTFRLPRTKYFFRATAVSYVPQYGDRLSQICFRRPRTSHIQAARFVARTRESSLLQRVQRRLN